MKKGEKMELRTNYQYTYFIHPFVIKEGKYQKYLLKMLKDKNCKLKIFQKGKDLKTYRYFLPKTRDLLFSSFSFSNAKLKKLEELPLDTRAALLSKYECNIFEYLLPKDIQGKVDDKKGIHFVIQKIEVICFKTGICFLCMKTNIEDAEKFSDILNFNYKFRDINQEENGLEGYDNIRLQTDTFGDIKTFKEFINNITGSNIEAMKLDINTERFLTYSYVCIDREAWNTTSSFDLIKEQYIKYANVLPADNSRYYNEKEIETLSMWKYAKLGLTKQGMMMFSSSNDMNNYTILPDEYENQYLYTYILNIYKKIYLKKLELEFKNEGKVKQARRKFIDFSKNLWIQEITEDETGTIINQKLQNTLELDRIYARTKNKYDILYKDLNIERDRRSTIIIAGVLVVSLILNFINLIALLGK